MLHNLLKFLPFLFLLSCGASHAEDSPKPKHPAVSKSLELTAKSLNGDGIISLSDYKGKVVLVNVWVSWCQACLQELPEIKRIGQEFSDKDFQIIGVNLDKPKNKILVKKIIKKGGIDYPVVSDPMASILTALGIGSIPVNILLNKSGQIAYVSVGYSPKHTKDIVKKIKENL